MERAASLIGTAMMVCWTFVLGPIGAFLLAAVAYSLVTQNFILGFVCLLSVVSPVALTCLWAPLTLMVWIRKKTRETELALEYAHAAK